MAARSVLRRSLLYGTSPSSCVKSQLILTHAVPGSSKRFLDKSATSSADSVIYDLEDSVTPANKSAARSLVRQALDTIPSASPRTERGVRINSVSSGLALQDLQEVLGSTSLKTIVLPKCDTAGDLTFVRDVIAHHHSSSSSGSQSPISVIALVESAKSLVNLNEICRAAPGLLSGLAFAAEDFALDLSLTRSPSNREILFARSSIVTAARAHELPTVLDLVTTSWQGESGQRQTVEDSREGKGLGFTGKQCIHPSQVDIANEAFAPSKEELEWAVRVTIGGQRAAEDGRGAWTLDGKMIDRPVEDKAGVIVNFARLCGMDVDLLMEKHARQTAS